MGHRRRRDEAGRVSTYRSLRYKGVPPLSIHSTNVRRGGDLHLREFHHLTGGEPWCHFLQHETAILPMQQREIGNHVSHAAFSSERISASPPQFRAALAVAVLHDDDQVASS